MATRTSTGKKGIISAINRAKKFGELAGRIDDAAIKQQDPQVQMMILQQKEQELAKAQQANASKVAQLQQQVDQFGDEQNLSSEEQKKLDEIKTEVENALKAGQKLSHQMKNAQEMKIDAQNKAAEEHSLRSRSTPSPV